MVNSIFYSLKVKLKLPSLLFPHLCTFVENVLQFTVVLYSSLFFLLVLVVLLDVVLVIVLLFSSLLLDCIPNFRA